MPYIPAVQANTILAAPPPPNDLHTLANGGLDGNYHTVHSLLKVGDDLYIGGSFTRTGDNAFNNFNGIVKHLTTGDTWIRSPMVVWLSRTFLNLLSSGKWY